MRSSVALLALAVTFSNYAYAYVPRISSNGRNDPDLSTVDSVHPHPHHRHNHLRHAEEPITMHSSSVDNTESGAQDDEREPTADELAWLAYANLYEFNDDDATIAVSEDYDDDDDDDDDDDFAVYSDEEDDDATIVDDNTAFNRNDRSVTSNTNDRSDMHRSGNSHVRFTDPDIAAAARRHQAALNAATRRAELHRAATEPTQQRPSYSKLLADDRAERSMYLRKVAAAHRMSLPRSSRQTRAAAAAY